MKVIVKKKYLGYAIGEEVEVRPQDAALLLPRGVVVLPDDGLTDDGLPGDGLPGDGLPGDELTDDIADDKLPARIERYKGPKKINKK